MKIKFLEEAFMKNTSKILELSNKIDVLEKLLTNKGENLQIEVESLIETDKNNDDDICPICDEHFISSGILEVHMNTHNDILQLDGNACESVININDVEYHENRQKNEYESKDPSNPEEAPYFFSDSNLEDFVIKCKLCEKEFDGKTDYDIHVGWYHQCDTCISTFNVGIHHCPYRDFILP